jgi:hypothetical protein
MWEIKTSGAKVCWNENRVFSIFESVEILGSDFKGDISVKRKTLESLFIEVVVEALTRGYRVAKDHGWI